MSAATPAARRRKVPTIAQMRVLVDRAERARGLTPGEAARLRAGLDRFASRRGDGTPAIADRYAALVRHLTALHSPLRRAGRDVCAHCSGWNGVRCLGLVAEWPCPSVAPITPKLPAS